MTMLFLMCTVVILLISYIVHLDVRNHAGELFILLAFGR